MTPAEIRDARLKHGPTQAEFGDLVGVTRVYIGELERGRALPDGPLARLLRVLHIPGVVEELQRPPE